MPGEISFRPSADDYAAVAKASFLRGVGRRRFLHWALITIAIGIGLFAAIGWLDHEYVSVTDVLIGLVVAIAWLGVVLGLTFLLVPRRTRRLFRQQRMLDKNFTLEWSDRGIVLRSDSSTSNLAWAEYHLWFESREIFGFGLNEQLYHFAPKRAMSEAQILDLRRTAEGRLIT